MNASTATPRLTAFPAAPRGDHRSPSKQLSPVRTAYAALAWVSCSPPFTSTGSSADRSGSAARGTRRGAKLKVVGWIVEVLAVVRVSRSAHG